MDNVVFIDQASEAKQHHFLLIVLSQLQRPARFKEIIDPTP